MTPASAKALVADLIDNGTAIVTITPRGDGSFQILAQSSGGPVDCKVISNLATKYNAISETTQALFV